ncbi:hypothetical protein BPAE_0024g00100 [Botrytis paeoniae]|uniref:Uncharacterized protein n=1 Tax=Botrytis paeoniae TaxID=278948 RepID=A0A4Z1FVW8_9HELO|nr:hypothetical protein BPAE_0024g00100 [Botrytis paeoniae]
MDYLTSRQSSYKDRISIDSIQEFHATDIEPYAKSFKLSHYRFSSRVNVLDNSATMWPSKCETMTNYPMIGNPTNGYESLGYELTKLPGP